MRSDAKKIAIMLYQDGMINAIVYNRMQMNAIYADKDKENDTDLILIMKRERHSFVLSQRKRGNNRMSKYNAYAKRLDEIARENFNTYRTAEAKLKEAESLKKPYPAKANASAEYFAEYSKAQHAYMLASDNLRKARLNLADSYKEVDALRAELAAEVEKDFCVNPADVDRNALELMKSGILKAADYSGLMESAKKNKNVTMIRLISEYTKKAAEASAKQHGVYSSETVKLREISTESISGDEILARFDDLAGSYKNYFSQNPSMIDRWEEMTAEAIEAF